MEIERKRKIFRVGDSSLQRLCTTCTVGCLPPITGLMKNDTQELFNGKPLGYEIKVILMKKLHFCIFIIKH